jgi:DNA-binding transcriptional LysR family regulator
MHQIDLRRVDLNLLVVFDVLMAEGTVSGAAVRLRRTQSAVSHSLARLRDQLGDPLLVKSGGRMMASPFGERLAADLGPILSSIRRALNPATQFDPASSTRGFRVALPDLNDALFPRLVERVRREAPSVLLEWAMRDERVLLSVAEGQIDLALVPSAESLPEGVQGAQVGAFRWASYLRRSHPAIRNWSRAEWGRWPHVAVRVGPHMPSPVDDAAALPKGGRRVSTWGPHFSAVAPLLARTDLIATLPAIVMFGATARHGLVTLPAPVPLEPMPHRLIWSRRLASDSAIRWLRAHLEQVFAEVLGEVERSMRGANASLRRKPA